MPPMLLPGVVGAGLVLEHRSFADLLEIPEAVAEALMSFNFFHSLCFMEHL